jgi:hypothetical protein
MTFLNDFISDYLGEIIFSNVILAMGSGASNRKRLLKVVGGGDQGRVCKFDMP